MLTPEGTFKLAKPPISRAVSLGERPVESDSTGLLGYAGYNHQAIKITEHNEDPITSIGKWTEVNRSGVRILLDSDDIKQPLGPMHEGVESATLAIVTKQMGYTSKTMVQIALFKLDYYLNHTFYYYPNSTCLTYTYELSGFLGVRDQL